jgi:hypothetical protein
MRRKHRKREMRERSCEGGERERKREREREREEERERNRVNTVEVHAKKAKERRKRRKEKRRKRSFLVTTAACLANTFSSPSVYGQSVAAPV